LPDELIKSIAQLLDQKMITFEAAYKISRLKSSDIENIIKHIESYPDQKMNSDKLKTLCAKSKKMEAGTLPKNEIEAIFIPPQIPQIMKKKKELWLKFIEKSTSLHYGRWLCQWRYGQADLWCASVLPMQRSFSDLKHSERATVQAAHYEAMKKKSGYRSDLIERIEELSKPQWGTG